MFIHYIESNGISSAISSAMDGLPSQFVCVCVCVYLLRLSEMQS